MERLVSEKGSLAVVGTGIRALSQITPEAMAHITNSDVVYYLVVDDTTRRAILKANSKAVSLGSSYGLTKPRDKTYAEIVDIVLAAVQAGNRVCLAVYGHPGICVWPGHEAIRKAQAAGFDALMLPGISSMDSLFADLGYDPTDCGYQFYEAADFLVHERPFDPTSLLVLCQVGLMGVVDNRATAHCWNPAAVEMLTDALLEKYPDEHAVTVYLASSLPNCAPFVKQVALGRLTGDDIPAMSTLVIPALPQRTGNPSIKAQLQASAIQTAAS